MSATAVQPEAMPDRQESQEVKPLIPTPERLSELLEMDINEVRRMYQSATERGQLVDQIMAEQETLSEHHSNIYRDEMEELIRVGGEQLASNPEASLFELEQALTEVQQTLAAKRDFLTETSPGDIPEGAEEKAALLERVKESEVASKTEKEKSLWRKAWDAVTWLPRKHPIITTLLALAGAAWGIYLLWDYLAEVIVVPNPMEGAGEVADTVVAPTGGAVEGIPQGEIALPNSELPTPGPQDYFNPGGNTPSDIFASPTQPPPPPVTGNIPTGNVPTGTPPVDLPPAPSPQGPPPPVPGRNPTDFFRRGPL